jgi:hypothetical protein
VFDIVTAMGLDNPGYESWQGQEIFLFSKLSRLALGPTQPSVYLVPGFFLGSKSGGG